MRAAAAIASAAKLASGPQTNRTFNPSALLGTFLVAKVEDLEGAFNSNIHGNLRKALGSVVLFSNGFSCEQLRPFAEKLGCKVVVILTYGVIGWNTKTKHNVEYEEKGVASDMGLPGPQHIVPGITVVAMKRGGNSPVLTTDAEPVPTVADGAALHMVMNPFSNQSSVDKVIYSEDYAVCIGGYCKEIFQLSGKSWESRQLATITFMKTPGMLVNLFNSYGIYEEVPKTAMETEGKIAADTLPKGFKPVYAICCNCVCRGTNVFPEPGVEARGLEKLWGSTLPIFGMVVCGEIGNDYELNPTGWYTSHRATEVTCVHSSNTVFCVVAEHTKPAEISDTAFELERQISTKKQSNMVRQMREYAQSKITEAIVPHNISAFIGATGDFRDVQRSMNFMDVCIPNYNGIAFWTYPGPLDGPTRYAKSTEDREVDFFVSHALKADPGSPNKMMKTPVVYALQKAASLYVGTHSVIVRMVTEGTLKMEDAFAYMAKLTYWTDIGCVDQVDIPKKMHIITNHLGDFVQNSRYVLCVVSTHYFTRAWCLYEFCICLKREHLDSIIVANVGLTWFERERNKVADSIVDIAFENSNCFDPTDRKIIEQKIRSEFSSIQHFNRLCKFAACALTMRATVFFGTEYFPEWNTVWTDAARRCGFVELAAVLGAVDLGALKKEARQKFPDEPGQTRCNERLSFIEQWVGKWFAAEVAPLLDTERRKAMRQSGAKEEMVDEIDTEVFERLVL